MQYGNVLFSVPFAAEFALLLWYASREEFITGPSYSYVDDELRKVARDAYVSWQDSRYSVPWAHAGRSPGGYLPSQAVLEVSGGS